MVNDVTAATPDPEHTGDRLPVAVDAMGNDRGPSVVVEGARIAAETFGTPVLLVGDPDQLGDVGDLPVSPASEVVEMGADPAKAVRKLKDSSIVRAAEAVRDGRASSLLSGGNTGAAMAASLLRMGRIKGVARPAIAVPFPVLGSTPSTLLDCGANAECQPEWLVQFARLGTAYARQRFGLEKPRVGTLTIGEEAGKGNTLVKAVCELLEQPEWAAECGATYVGNVEGGDLMNGAADVIVCDGFTGNVALKALEGGMEIFKGALRESFKNAPELEHVAEPIDKAIDPLFKIFDAGATGAAMLLGTRGVTLIAHGSSSAMVIANAIRTADELAAAGIVNHLRESVGTAPK
ncbi:MAG: phosphate acyltransferase PlsX [Actinomycetota bacterium]